MKRLIFSLACFLLPLCVFCEIVQSEYFKYSIDLPEMFYIEEMSGDERDVLFLNEKIPVQLAVKVYPAEMFQSAQECLSFTLKKLSAEGDTASVLWRNRTCALSSFQTGSGFPTGESVGWGAAVPEQDGNMLTFLCFAPAFAADECQSVILSVLDSILVDYASGREAGLVTSFAFPREKQKRIRLEIGGKTVETSMDETDIVANQFVVDREFDVFKLFASDECWKEAWQRFYRIIAKDSMGRIKQAANDIFRVLLPDALEMDGENPSAALAQILLNWTQTFPYERKSASAERADFTNIPAAMTGSGSDCDSRSILLASMYTLLNMDSVMLVSVDYSHAMVGIVLDGKKGQTYSLDGKEYLFGETTARNLTFGKIDSTMQDREKWIPVELY